jgi:hypothetical protein
MDHECHAKAPRRECLRGTSMMRGGILIVAVLGLLGSWMANRMVSKPKSVGDEMLSQVAASSAKAKPSATGFSLGLQCSRAVLRPKKTLVGKEILPCRSPKDPKGPVVDLGRLLGPGSPPPAIGVEPILMPAVFTRRYHAPLFFMGGEAVDPFLNEGVASERTKSAKEILMENGVEFEEDGSIAFYIRSASELVVRATADQLEQVDRLVEEWQAPDGESGRNED